MENLIYSPLTRQPVGIEVAGRILWYASATAEDREVIRNAYQ